MKKFILLILIIFTLSITGCSHLKKTVPQNNQPAAQTNETKPSIPVVPEGQDPELWMGDYGSLQTDDNNGGYLYIVDKNNNKTTISEKMNSPIGFFFKVSPDRINVAYVELEDAAQEKYNVAVYNASTKSSHKILSGITSVPEYIHWAPDGKLIAVNDVTNSDDYSKTQFDCTIYDSETWSIVAKIPAVDFNWSPDGKNIAFVKVPDDIGKYTFAGEDSIVTLSNSIGIYSLDKNTTSIYKIEGNCAVFTTPEYSSDGSKVVFVSAKLKGQSQNQPAGMEELSSDSIYIYSPDNGSAKKITDDAFINSNNPENGYGVVKLCKDLLSYGGVMKDSIKVVNLKTNQSKVYSGPAELPSENDDSFTWQGDGSLKISLKDGKVITLNQNLEEK